MPSGNSNSSRVIVPAGDSDIDRSRPSGLLGFYSYIQKYYTVEVNLSRHGKKLPETAFNILDNIWIANLAIKSTLLAELPLFLSIFFPVYVLIKSGVWHPIPSLQPHHYGVSLYTFNFATVIFSTAFYYWLSKYYLPDSVIVKNAMRTLYAGRAAGLMLKGIIFFLLISLFGSFFYEEEVMKSFSKFMAFMLNIEDTVDLTHPAMYLSVIAMFIVSSYFLYVTGRTFFLIFSLILIFFYVLILVVDGATYEKVYEAVKKTKSTVFAEMFIIPSFLFFSAALSYLPILARDFMWKKSREFKYSKDVFRKDATHIGWGYDVDSDNIEIKPVYISEQARNLHLGVAGNTGTGKTRMMEYMVEQDIRKGHSVVVIEPKGDKEFLSRVIQVAKEEGRLDDIIYVSPVYPEMSDEFNPLSTYLIPEEIVSNVMAMVGVSKEKFFTDVQKNAILLIVEALRFIHHTNPDFVYTFEELTSYATHEGIKKLQQTLKGVLDSITDEKLKAEGESINRRLVQVVEEQEPQFFVKVTTGLKVVLDIISLGNVSKIIGSAKRNRFIEMIEKGQSPILIIQTQSLMIDDTSKLVAKLTMNIIKNLAGRFNAEGKRFKVPLKVHIDEAARAMPPEVEDLLAMGRSVGIHLTFYFQSVNQFYQELGEEKAKSALDLIGSFIVFRVQRSTAEYFANMIGETDKKPTVIIGAEGNISVTFKGGYLVDPEQLTNLPDRTAIVYLKPEHQDLWSIKRNTYFVRVPQIEDTYVKVKFPDRGGRVGKDG